jgi:copper chaperone NosL
MRNFLLTLVLVLAMTAGGLAANQPVKPATGDKCPVCGMFVAKYPNFLAQLRYQDGSYAVFDGAKDLFKYLQNLRRYAPGKQESAIAALQVTDYYSLQPIAARTAWYVVGSDVYGPMGKELIAFGKETDAAEFKKDHLGKKILRFTDVTPALIATLE